MNIDNIVLVRTLCTLPLNGELTSSCDQKYLHLDTASDYSFVIRDIIKSKLEKEKGRELSVEELEREVSKYYSLSSSYSSKISFCLNGIAPDNEVYTYSDKKIAVIDPLKYHLNEDFVNINPIDTAIKNKIKNSNYAILVIEKELFESLSLQDKVDLMSYYQIEIFTDSIREGVNNALLKYNYPIVPLSNNFSDNYILDCEEKRSLINFQQEFSDKMQISKLTTSSLLFDLIFFGKHDKMSASKINKDYRKDVIIYEYYRDKLYEFLEMKALEYNIVLTEEERLLLYSGNAKSSLILRNFLLRLIKTIGLQKFESLIQEFNQMVIENYLTNTEILNLKGYGRK